MTNLFVDAQDKIDRCLNSFATESFRDQADRDYIHARLACRSELFPQFLWSSHQALEKYLKAILLYNRIEATRVRHDILGALALTRHLPFKIELSNRSKRFLDHVADLGEHRYLDVPYYVHGHVMVDLDLCVWELRRYCQVLNVFGKRSLQSKNHYSRRRRLIWNLAGASLDTYSGYTAVTWKRSWTIRVTQADPHSSGIIHATGYAHVKSYGPALNACAESVTAALSRNSS